VLTAIGTFFVVGALVVIPARNDIARTWDGLFGSGTDNALELATVCLGALTWLALAVFPALAVAVLPPSLMLHRAVLVKQLEVPATTDSRTGVLNPAGWHGRAERELARLRQRAATGLPMIDLDHFKRHNDTHGRPRGHR